MNSGTSSDGGQTLGSFVKIFNSSVCPVDYKEYDDEYNAPSEFRYINIGSVDILDYKGPSFRSAVHCPRHIDGDDVFLFFQPLTVSFELSQSGSTTVVEPGYLALSTTLQPFATSNRVDPQRNYMEQRVIRVHGSQMRQCIPASERYCAKPISVQHGAGGILNSMINACVAEGRALTRSQGEIFSSMLVNAIGTTLLDSAAMRDTDSPHEEADARLRLKAKAFAESHLSHPHLTPTLIAEHCHVSVRRLHTAFEASATTVGNLIRDLRLRRCQEELRDPAFNRQPIFQIALRWGYSNAENFSRAYRRKFGISPIQERHSDPSMQPPSGDYP